jgi:hypothetical protein
VSGTEGTIRLDHFLRTGFEMFTATGEGGYVAEKAEGQIGWLFPVGDEVHALGYIHMFQDMLDAREAGREPMETFYDGYVVNAIIDACYKSMRSGRWEPVELALWRGGKAEPGADGLRKVSREKAGKHRVKTQHIRSARGTAGEAGKAESSIGGEKGGRKGPLKGPKKAPGRPQEGKNSSGEGERRGAPRNAGFIVIKTERLPDGRTKRILKDKATGRVVERIE